MKKKEFESLFLVAITAGRLNVLPDRKNSDCFYSTEMYSSENPKKIYLVELSHDYFMLYYDVVFDENVKKFFYISKERCEYNEAKLKYAIKVMRATERKVHETFAKLNLRGFYNRRDFIHKLIYLIPRLEFDGSHVKDRASNRIFITIKDEDTLYLTYKDGQLESFMDIMVKDLNERILKQCEEMIRSSISYEKL